MYPLSAEARAALESGEQRAASRAEILRDGVVTLTLPAVGGYVTVDRTAEYRRVCDIVLEDADGTLTPGTPAHPLAPYGTEVRVARAVIYPAGRPVSLVVTPANWTEGTSDPAIALGHDGALILGGHGPIAEAPPLVPTELPPAAIHTEVIKALRGTWRTRSGATKALGAKWNVAIVITGFGGTPFGTTPFGS